MTMGGRFRRREEPLCTRDMRLAVVIAGLGICSLWAFGRVGLRLNASPSLPIGLYMTTEDSLASLVEFCPDEPAASLGISRGYRSRGSCPDGASPLLKPVIAVSGDVVQVSALGVAVNGQLLPNTRPHAADSHGQPIPRISEGIYPVAAGTVWVASSYDPRSFDSRYFGPIRVSTIRHHVRPLLTE